MTLRNLIIASLLLILSLGCSNSGNEAGAKGNSQGLNAESANAILPRELNPSRYTGGPKWVNGIDTKEKNVFFITLAKNAPNPVKIGYRVQFAAAGEAVVRQVYRLKKSDKDSLFIRVNKNLDSKGDGFPNSVYVKGFELKADYYTKEGKWSNGINLENPKMFLIKIGKFEPTPLRVGDRLKFAQTGETVVVQVSRQAGDDNFASILVTVNKPLNPAADGSPNPIEAIFND